MVFDPVARAMERASEEADFSSTLIANRTLIAALPAMRERVRSYHPVIWHDTYGITQEEYLTALDSLERSCIRWLESNG